MTTACPVCGKEFAYYRSWPRKYCSNACKGKALVTNIGRHVETRYTATCEQCGVCFETTPGVTRGRFCSSLCWGKWLSIHRVGESHPNLGRKFGRAKNLPPPTIKVCPICQKPFDVKPSQAERRVYCSKKCMGVAQAAQWAGVNNPGWTGGYEPYYGPSWRPAMRSARERDKACQRCGKTPKELGRELDVHHITPFKSFGVDRHTEANDLSNLISLCNTCHLELEWETNRRPQT